MVLRALSDICKHHCTLIKLGNICGCAAGEIIPK